MTSPFISKPAPIEFVQDTKEDGTRHYVGRFEDGTEVRLPSVTTILGAVYPKPWLAPWAAKAAIEAVENCLESGVELDSFQLDICKNAHRRRSTHGKNIGSQVHEVIEAWLGGGSWWDLTEGKTQEVHRALEGWREWWDAQGLQVLTLEATVYDLDNRYAGRMDFGSGGAKIVLIDWKTSEQWSEDWALQLVAYAKAAIKCGIVPRVDHITIGRFSKAGETEVRSSRTDPALAPDKWDSIFEAFLAARNWFYWLREHGKKVKP